MKQTLKRQTTTNVEDLKRRIFILEHTLKRHGIPVPMVKPPANLVPSKKSLRTIKKFRTHERRTLNAIDPKPTAFVKQTIYSA